MWNFWTSRCGQSSDGVIIVTVLVVFLAGMSLGHLLAAPGTEPTRVAMNDLAPVSPEGLPLVVHR
jgi:hypothetical protein